jgi:NAD(P)-dependent dehydrogenase (short-subunit alcohol dehydrogenase family)
MSLVSRIRGRHGASGFGYASTAEEVTQGLQLHGQNILITGVNSGLGAESARVLTRRGATIFGAARTQDKAAQALRPFGASAVPLACELSEPASVRACVAAVKDALQARAARAERAERAENAKLDVILCNAGVMALAKREVRYGQELQFLTNHIGHFMLVTGLLDQLSDRGRVVVVSSAAHEHAPPGGIKLDDLSLTRGYTPWLAYGQSKLANLLFARALARRLSGTQRTANALHPGVIATQLMRHMGTLAQTASLAANRLFFKSVGEGAATQCYLAAHPSVAGISGEYFANSNIARPSLHARDDALAEKLWAVSERIVATL